MLLAERNRGIDARVNGYNEIKRWRQEQLITVSNNHNKLNSFHDEVIYKTVQLAIDRMRSEWGKPPAPFAFFLMGSGGRFEQSVWSDQDHGIIFAGDNTHQLYFLALGKEIVNGLTVVGYEQCDGKVMSSNPLWCQSISDWENQIAEWLNEASWQSLRHFLTFFDSRVLIGEASFLDQVKEEAFLLLDKQPKLYLRLIDNVDFIKKGIGFFGQLLPEQHGKKTGSIKLKQTTFFPYINALRLLALKEKIVYPSTITRFSKLPSHYNTIKAYETDFLHLLDFRLRYRKNAASYQEVHLVSIHSLTKKEKQTLKYLMKQGYKLFSETKSIIENECSTWE